MHDSQLLIRDAAPGDVDVIVEIHTEARAAYYLEGGRSADEIDPPGSTEKRRESWARCLRSDARVVCAEWAEQVVGIALMAPVRATADAGAGELYALHVLRSHWGRGVGSRLHAVYVEYLQSSSMPVGELEVWDRNSRALSFYGRRGWELDGRQRVDSDGVYLRMRLDVAALSMP